MRQRPIKEGSCSECGRPYTIRVNDFTVIETALSTTKEPLLIIRKAQTRSPFGGFICPDPEEHGPIEDLVVIHICSAMSAIVLGWGALTAHMEAVNAKHNPTIKEDHSSQ